jgi:hypothetical protein
MKLKANEDTEANLIILSNRTTTHIYFNIAWKLNWRITEI